MKSLNLRSFFSVSLFLIFSLMVLLPVAYAASEQPEIVVEVYINKYDEKYIVDTVLDDGTQIKDHSYIIKYAALPASTQGWPLGDYFNYAAWITRDGVISLSLDPTNEVRNNYSRALDGWDCLRSPVNGFGGDSKWPSNDQCLQWQYICHFNFAKSKDRWNLEPSRTAASYLDVVYAGCNP